MTHPDDHLPLAQPDWQQPGARFDVTFSWRLPDNIRLWADFTVEVIELNEAMMRLNARLVESKSIRASKSPEIVDPDLITQIEGLVGRIVKVPYEAATGTTLHLRMETLTGEHSYFAEALSDD